MDVRILKKLPSAKFDLNFFKPTIFFYKIRKSFFFVVLQSIQREIITVEIEVARSALKAYSTK